jgi:hypothetical protein
MTVYANKPAFNVREKLKELEKPSGIAGRAMLAADTPQEQFDLIGAGRRNILINGDFQVSQRGDFTTASSMTNAYKLDRWLCDHNGTATLQHTTGHDILGTPAICKAIKVVQTVTGTNYLGVRQKIENPSIYAGRTFTYSAWVRSNTRNARIECYIPGTTPNKYVGSSHSGNGQWEYLSFTFTINSGTPSEFLADVFIDNGVYGNTTITAGDYFECTMLQLELGKVATPFEHRSYGEELALCQRYFERLEDLGSTDSNGAASVETLIGIGYVYTTTRVMGHVTWKATKRVNPTCTVSPVTDIQCLSSTGAWISATGVDVRANKNSARLDITTGSAMPAAGQACEIRFNTASPVGYIYIDAEL